MTIHLILMTLPTTMAGEEEEAEVAGVEVILMEIHPTMARAETATRRRRRHHRRRRRIRAVMTVLMRCSILMGLAFRT